MENAVNTTALMEQAGIGIVITDLNGIITEFNPAAAILYGYPPDEIVGKTWRRLVVPYMRGDDDRAASNAAQEGHTVNLMSEHITKDNRIITVYQVVSAWKSEEGRVSGVLRCCFDFTERGNQQRLLQQERDLLEAILETANDGFLMLDAEGQVVIANLQFETIFQLPRFQIAGRNVDDLVTMIRERPDLPTELATLLANFSGDTYQNAGGELVVPIPTKRELVYYCSPVHGHDGAIMGRLFVFRDATRERELDRMKTEFVSLVSHELRTPLTSIKGFAEFILDGDAGVISADVREYVEIVKLSAERLTGLINDILDLTRLESGRIVLRPEVNVLSELIDTIVVSMRPMLESRKQTLAVHVMEGMPPVWADRERLIQVLSNLVSNASKYGKEGGRVNVRAWVVQADDTLPPGTITTVELPAFVISVTDDGIGIASDDQSQVFNRFFRTDEANRLQIQGSGLGLTIVKSFIELHGGKIWLNSERGQGTTFFFTLPVVEGI